MSDAFLQYLEDNFSKSHISVSQIRNLKRKWDVAEEFSDYDEEELVAAADMIESNYRKRKRQKGDSETKINDEVLSVSNDEEELLGGDDTRQTDNPKFHMCETCGKKYTLLQNLSRHMKTHTVGFSCRCGKRFSRKHALNKHIEICKNNHLRTSTHREDISFPCTHCNIPFPSYETLFKHVESNHSLFQRGGNIRKKNKNTRTVR